MIGALYHAFIYDPLANTLAFFINILPGQDAGLAIIALTILVRIILFPLNHQAALTQRKMRIIEPEVRRIKEKNVKDPQAQAKAMMALYREHGIKPFSSIISLFIQIPIIFALYQVFLLGGRLTDIPLYSFIPRPDVTHLTLLGLLDLTEKSFFLALLAGLSQYLQIRLMTPAAAALNKGGQSFGDNLAKSMAFQMKYIMPVFVVFISATLPSAIALYWTTMNLFAIMHELIVARRAKKLSHEPGTQPNNQSPH